MPCRNAGGCSIGRSVGWRSGPARVQGAAGTDTTVRSAAGRNVIAIWQDLVDDHGLPARYASVRRFPAQRSGRAPQARGCEPYHELIIASVYRETHTFLEELAEAMLAHTRKGYLAELARAHLLIIDDLGMRKLPHTAAEDLLN